MRAALRTVLFSRGFGPDLITNGTFDADLTGWTDSDTGTGESTWSAGAMRLVGVDGSNRARRSQVKTLVSGRTYRITFDYVASSGAASIAVGTAVGSASMVSIAGTLGIGFFVASQASVTITAMTGSGGGDVTFDNITLKEQL
ncbi:hypothetical protein [Mesorhizobium sp.]|uniref:hypothetical protein n=1 Tax=Mesorhizobium sp. TaxID=1871066 RepID=UPI000FEAB005|nr:hypothetical protein [Mesorhizobium sp.]RWJ41570.1 MAG: hypothetical protein EOR31_25780 [Mesorhizobium sp.]